MRKIKFKKQKVPREYSGLQQGYSFGQEFSLCVISFCPISQALMCGQPTGLQSINRWRGWEEAEKASLPDGEID